MREVILATDGYKLDHRRQYPEGTEKVYSNWTPRSCKLYPEAEEGAVVFGIQYLIKEYFINQFNEDFFGMPKDIAVNEFKRRVDDYLGPNQVGKEHIAALYDLGYLPIRIKALPEGSICPIRVPALTLTNTILDFFWLTNYLETVSSNSLWLPMTSATTARLFKKELVRHAKKTGYYDDPNVVLGFSCHDFSMRGMAGVEASIISGMGHLTSFIGSETIPAIYACEEYYRGKESAIIASTVPATEHSVMCAGGIDDEFETFKRLITETYPNGFVSIVSDTWDFWKVITEYMPALKDTIMARNGRVVIRPDSGDPVKIIAGYSKEEIDNLSEEELKNTPMCVITGAYDYLYSIFGGAINDAGYKVLDTHIGMIYGDSITLDRQKEIYRRLEEKGFAATNLVLGIGSYTYQYKTRDSLGFAMKATWCQINGKPTEIFKDPKTDSGMKKSLKGLIKVVEEEGKYVAIDQVSPEEEQRGALVTVFEDGKLLVEHSLEEIRQRIDASL